ncbi:hypothetical protein PG988_011216 [Apiospora saccharicola]
MTLGDVPGSSVIERRSMGERFLKGIREAWEEHNTSMNMTADILMYLDRGFTQGQNRPTIFAATIGLVEFEKRRQEGCHPTGPRRGKYGWARTKKSALKTALSVRVIELGSEIEKVLAQPAFAVIVDEKSATNCDQPTNNDDQPKNSGDQPKNSGDQPKNKRNSTSAQLTAAAVKWVDRRRRQSGRCWVFGGWPDGKKRR